MATSIKVILVPILGVPTKGPQSVAPAILPFVSALYRYARSLGASFVITSGYRTQAQQNDLQRRWMQGDPSVVYPPARHSYHELGLALDIESDRLPALGAYSESLGMRWGGRFGDPVHFDLGKR